jgi:hypothetical protein
MLTDVRMVAGDASVQSMWDELHGGAMMSILVGTPARLIGTVHAQQVVSAVESGR